MSNDLLSHIKQQYGGFSKGQKRIADYVLAHYDKAAFMTAAKLGNVTGVSESTVVRFATELGYDGYPGLQRALQEMIRNKLTSIQRMDIAGERIGAEEVLDKVLALDIEKIRQTLEETSRDDFRQAALAIAEAKNIYIIASGSASAVAKLLHYYFSLMFGNVHFIDGASTSAMFQQIMRIDQHDVMIGLSFPRYSKHTSRAFDYASDCGAKIIAITDAQSSPLVKKANYTLLARSEMASFVDSLVAPLSLVNALIVAVGIHCREQVADVFQKLEYIWDEYDIYEKSDN